jgi:hypothetical protein
MSSKMIAWIRGQRQNQFKREVLSSLPHAIFPKGPIAFRPNAEPSSMLYKLVVFQTNGRIFSERLLAAYIGA